MLTNIKRVYLSLITLILVIMIFGTVTYAWISMASVNTIDGMSLTATSGNELEISVDGITYSTHVSMTVLEDLIEDIRMTDITSSDGIHFESGGLNATNEINANIDYLSFELWFQTIRPEHYVYLIENVSALVAFDTTLDGTYVVSRGVSWKSNYTFQNGPNVDDLVLKGNESLYYGSQAVRISFEEIIDTSNVHDNRTQDELNRLIFDPSSDETRGYGVPYGAYSYFMQHNENLIELPQHIPDITYRLTTFDDNNPYQAINNDSMIATLQPSDVLHECGKNYFRGKVRVNIWIEGWDADAFDSILNDRLKIQLQFKVANKATSI